MPSYFGVEWDLLMLIVVNSLKPQRSELCNQSENQSLADRPRRQDMDDPREFLSRQNTAAEEPEIFGHMRAEMTRI